ncbi:hypothetical protein BHE90_007867 [Fusarium euwallaceae]|uniref:Uncharacterized protein n=4 Tax=Fusarium solani species complex TaxID=232080 RepID=A0A3M2RR95_9HYPO|nr:hypothetical protein CDV36_012614 [Fusarium kuroshium]RSL48671.1 hypothetical protein CEP51_015598 [Fusarium floridanum]RSL91079.1 hypothetical protein CEP52_014367 [Fusarium oligoseptatum]RTE77629.1 hypothetical protein BHE90_007867 [Fusarium euwallaceae]
MSDFGEVHVGAIISLTAPEEGYNVWRAEQVSAARNLPPGDDRSRLPFEWSLGPIKTTGYINTDSWEIGVSNSIVGINVGTIYGDLRDGVGLDISLSAAKGSIKWYLKNGRELWARLDVRTSPNGSVSDDYKIIVI